MTLNRIPIIVLVHKNSSKKEVRKKEKVNKDLSMLYLCQVIF